MDGRKAVVNNLESVYVSMSACPTSAKAGKTQRIKANPQNAKRIEQAIRETSRLIGGGFSMKPTWAARPGS
jgi:hypothetical protein